MSLICAAVYLTLGLTNACIPDQARLTVYDTALCAEGEECLQGNGDGLFASMTPVTPEWYGEMAACPPELFGWHVHIPYFGKSIWCGDNFGTLDGNPVDTIEWDEEYGWYIRMDIFWPVASEGYPEWNYYMVEIDA
jgi:hypothetical protein